jgi:hypothetical protein
MSFYGFVLSACNGRFDARHLMVAGSCVMTAVLFSSSVEGIKATSNEPLGQYARTATVTLPLVKPVKTVTVAAIDQSYSPAFVKTPELTLFNSRKLSKETPLTRVSELKAEASLIENSIKGRESCSAEAARAAARGDTSKISPCIADLLSGDEERIKNMPVNMAKFFIETMSDPNAAENAPQIFINSMMAMMEAMGSASESAETPKDTASTK